MCKFLLKLRIMCVSPSDPIIVSLSIVKKNKFSTVGSLARNQII